MRQAAFLTPDFHRFPKDDSLDEFAYQRHYRRHRVATRCHRWAVSVWLFGADSARRTRTGPTTDLLALLAGGRSACVASVCAENQAGGYLRLRFARDALPHHGVCHVADEGAGVVWQCALGAQRRSVPARCAEGRSAWIDCLPLRSPLHPHPVQALVAGGQYPWRQGRERGHSEFVGMAGVGGDPGRQARGMGKNRRPARQIRPGVYVRSVQ